MHINRTHKKTEHHSNTQHTYIHLDIDRRKNYARANPPCDARNERKTKSSARQACQNIKAKEKITQHTKKKYNIPFYYAVRFHTILVAVICLRLPSHIYTLSVYRAIR